ncbi:hypothetical protein EB796_007517 [Bugula neritina]|uniref:Uncharacterized protein n=1 Tax=Bugula neritina TaxID=10212 RepID=A0A7J7K6D4_BUGNE|nr:hypothetical protein EB796_007517 [Bugula neritina]
MSFRLKVNLVVKTLLSPQNSTQTETLFTTVGCNLVSVNGSVDLLGPNHAKVFLRFEIVALYSSIRSHL